MNNDFPCYNPAFDADEIENRKLIRQLYWLTDHERSPYCLADDPAWPGLFPETSEMKRYVDNLRQESSRQVDCRFQLGYADIPGLYDLVTGEMFVVYDGEYQLAQDFPDQVVILFPQMTTPTTLTVKVENGVSVLAESSGAPEKMTLSEMFSRPRTATYEQLNGLVERLHAAGQLPAVERVS